MLSIGFFEILIIAVLGLTVFGPEKLPEAIRTFALGFSKVKHSWNSTRRELEQELGLDDLRREIHNAQVMKDIERIKEKTKELSKDVEESIALSKDAASIDSPKHIDSHKNRDQDGSVESEKLASNKVKVDEMSSDSSDKSSGKSSNKSSDHADKT